MVRLCRWFFCVTVSAVLGSVRAEAAPNVPGFERFGRLAVSPEQKIDSGLLLLGELGCVNCHAPQPWQAAHLMPKRGPSLDRVGERLDRAWIAAYLKNPHASAPHTTMPYALAGVSDTSREDIAEALTHLLASPGEFGAAASSARQPGNAAEGTAIFNRMGCAACHGRQNATDHLPDHVPLRGLGAKWDLSSLERFLRDPFAVRPSSRMPAFAMSEHESSHLVASLLDESSAANTTLREVVAVHGRVGSAGDGEFAVDAARAERGRVAFASVGCANCHDLTSADGRTIAPTKAARPLAELVIDRGCLATSHQPGNGPDYGLDECQRVAIKAALEWLVSPAGKEPPSRERQIGRTLTALNCYACHVRDGRGGTELAVPKRDDDGEPITKDVARDALFTSMVQELGDEGRLPPTLTGVGDKLNPQFLRDVLAKGNHDRHMYMHTRMPRWHAAVAEPLAALLAEDAKTDGPPPALTGHPEQDVVDAGRFLTGSKALGCIKCHAFTHERGQSLGVIPMTRFPARLRHEWFLAYVADPQRFRPGTRMPASWPEGKVFFADVLDGSAAGQIESVWRYVSSREPRPPVGINGEPIEIVAMKRPVIYRNFIKDAGPRAIGVGFPEKVNIAWDAQALRLALVWKGGFIDAGRHWSGRGEGWQPPLGEGVFAPDPAPPLAALGAVDAPWPDKPVRERGGKFRGYSLDAEGRPTFKWSLGEMQVTESFQPVVEAGKPLLRRTIHLRQPSPDGTVVFRPVSAEKIEELDDGWMRINGFWKVRVQCPGEPSRIQTGKATELRYPVAWAVASVPPGAAAPAAKTVIVEEFSW